MFYCFHHFVDLVNSSSTNVTTATAGADCETANVKLNDGDKRVSPEVDWSGGGQLPKATAMYEFLATRNDEINMVINEQVVLLGTGDGEDWVKVRWITRNRITPNCCNTFFHVF